MVQYNSGGGSRKSPTDRACRIVLPWTERSKMTVASQQEVGRHKQRPRRSFLVLVPLSYLSLLQVFQEAATAWEIPPSPPLVGRRSIAMNLPTLIATGAALFGPPNSSMNIPTAWADSSLLLPSQKSTENCIDGGLDDSILPLPRSLNNRIYLPRIGYSMYKTVPEQVAEGVGLALLAGVRHFDCASQYGTNSEVGRALKRYIETGEVETRQGVTTLSIQDPELQREKKQQQQIRRRKELFLTHKVSNAEQSLSATQLQREVLKQGRVLLGNVGLDRPNSHGKDNSNHSKPGLDLVLVHSPLTDRNRRVSTYAALCDLLEQHKVGAVGVCHFGVAALQELVDAGLPAPSVIQLELSPFNQHADVDAWATAHNSLLSCAAWSKLSSTNGPIQGWDVLGKIAKERYMTKQQVLIRWAIQRGYLCVPRSSSQYKIERQAIVENSWESTSDFVLSEKEMIILNGLDEQIPAGQLGVMDGWGETDVVDNKWDPTTALV